MSDRRVPVRLIHVLLIAALGAVTPQASAESAAAKKKKAAQAKAKAKAQVKSQKIPAQATSSNERGGQIGMKKSESALPQSQALVAPTARNVEMVKPPKSGNFLDGGSKEAEYERLLDEEIKQLYALSQRSRTSPNRGEIWLRLGERYVEKARLIDLREQADYEKRLKDFAEKKTKIRPQLNTKASREYNQKAVQLYEWFIKDFPRDPKVDQALFFLGYNQFELGSPQMGERYYTDLVKKYPDSLFITESRFALGEFYFENENWKKALENYSQVVKVKRARLNTFALYKSAWCLYRLNRTKVALQALEKVVRQSHSGDRDDGAPGGRKPVNKLRLAAEALKDYVPFYAEVGDPHQAEAEFMRVSGNEKQTLQMLERLAFIYADSGNRDGAASTFRNLIGKNPAGERAAEYQYQIVLQYATRDQKEFRKQLDIWLESFGPGSLWAKENAKNEKLVGDVAKLQETTLRNFVLQQHQAAQNSHAPYSQSVANAAYGQYFKYFANSPKIVEMQFFHAELLFDMGKYEDAATLYSWVAEKEPQGSYHEKAIVNSVLALEKALPSEKAIEAKRGNSLDPIPFDPPVARFEKAALRYIQAIPKGEKTSDIQRRLGVLYYSYNHFDEAIGLFEKIIKENPKSANAEIAGNLILDIYKLKNDMASFADKGQEFLANPAIASTKFGAQVRVMMEKAGYLKAEKIAKSGDSAKAAREYEAFAVANKQSDLTVAARYEAAVNYEKAGDLAAAIRNHGFVMAAQASNPKIKEAQNDSRNALARIYQQTGQLEAAAKLYQSYAMSNPNDPKGINAYYNAGVLWDSLGESGEAIRAYDHYFAKSSKSDRVEVLYAEAEIYRRQGAETKAATAYDKYLKAGAHNEAHAIHATYFIAQHAEKTGQISKAKQGYQKTIAMYKSATKSAQEETVKYAAEARFKLAQETLAQLLAIRFGVTDKTQAKAAVQVKTLREKYIGEMKDVIRYDYGGYIVAALTSGGKMFDSLALLFARIPVPAGFQADEAAKYKELIQAQINGFKNEAKNSYKTALDKARELEVYNQWTKSAQQGLAALDSSAENTGEIAVEARAADWMGL